MQTMDFSEVVEFHDRNQNKPLRLPDSKLPKVAYATDAGVLFVTRDQDEKSGLFGYNVRRQKVTGLIELAGKSNPHSTRQDANREIHRLHLGR